MINRGKGAFKMMMNNNEFYVFSFSDEDIQECLFKGKSNCSTLIKDVNEAKTPEAETPKAKPMRSRSSSRG